MKIYGGEKVRNAKFENWVTLLIGVWIFFMPWTIGYSRTESRMDFAMWNFFIVGALVFIIATLALQAIKPWEEWMNVVAGIWLFSSPWIFGYTDEAALFLYSMFCGMIIAILSGIAIPVANRKQKQLH